MFILAFYILLGIAGFLINIASVIFGGMFSILGVFAGTTLLLFPLMQFPALVKQKKLMAFFQTKKDWEEMCLFVNDRFQIVPLNVSNKHEGVLTKNKLGLIQDKGTPLTWGKERMSIAMQRSGVTVDLRNAQYTANLKKEKDIDDYEEMIRRYLGPLRYAQFYKVFRREPKPDINHIQNELEFLLSVQDANDPLDSKVFGETVNFRHYLQGLKYMYHPLSAENAMNAEKIQAKREAQDYGQAQKFSNIGKFILMLIIGIMIFFVVMNATGGLNFLF